MPRDRKKVETRGRKPIGQRVHVHLTPEMVDGLEALIPERYETRAAIIRLAIQRFLRAEERKRR